MVKKILIMIMTVAVTLSPVTAFASDNAEGEMQAAEEASGVDISALSDVQIEALSQEVNQEIMNRGIEKKAEITPGEYTAGTDIPVGKYDFFSPTDNKTLGEIAVTRADENDEFLWKNAPIEEDFQYQFELKKGDILKVRRAGTLTMVAGGVKFQ